MKPKLSGVRTKPKPKWYCHTRFTHTRAVSGFFGSVIHCASCNRRVVVFAPTGGAASGSVERGNHRELARFDHRAGSVRVALLQELDWRGVAPAVGPAEHAVVAERLRVRPAEVLARPRLMKPAQNAPAMR